MEILRFAQDDSAGLVHIASPKNSFRPTVYLPDPCLPGWPYIRKSEISNLKSPIKSKSSAACRCAPVRNFPTRARKHKHHANLAGITSPQRNSFRPTVYLPDPCLPKWPTSAKSQIWISNLQWKKGGTNRPSCNRQV